MYIQRIVTNATAGASSQIVPINIAKKTAFVCQRSAHSSGNSTFKIQVRATDAAGNSSGWIDYDRAIVNIANANTETITRSLVAITLAANGSDFMSLSPEDVFSEAKVVHTRTTDGTNNVWAITQ